MEMISSSSLALSKCLILLLTNNNPQPPLKHGLGFIITESTDWVAFLTVTTVSKLPIIDLVAFLTYAILQDSKHDWVAFLAIGVVSKLPSTNWVSFLICFLPHFRIIISTALICSSLLILLKWISSISWFIHSVVKSATISLCFFVVLIMTSFFQVCVVRVYLLLYFWGLNLI